MSCVFPEPTPNPSAMKFVCEKPVVASGSLSFSTKEKAAGHPIAAKLFEIEGVTNVFILNNFITVNIKDPIYWDDLTPQIQNVIENNI